MAELKECEAYICHNQYRSKIKCYRKEDVDKRIAELEAENAMLKESQRWLKCSEKLPEE